MTTPTTKTTEEILLDEYSYVLKLAKVLDTIVLPEDRFSTTLDRNYANQALIQRLTNSFEERKRKTSQLAVLTNIDFNALRKFFEAELRKSGTFIRLNLSNLNVETSD